MDVVYLMHWDVPLSQIKCLRANESDDILSRRDVHGVPESEQQTMLLEQLPYSERILNWKLNLSSDSFIIRLSKIVVHATIV